MAGMPGLEPGTDEPESSVLPITPHPSGIMKMFEGYYTTICSFVKKHFAGLSAG